MPHLKIVVRDDMALANLKDSIEPRILQENERLSLIGTLLLGWQIEMNEEGEGIFTEALYSFIPDFIVIAKSVATHSSQQNIMVFAIPEENEGTIKRCIPPFPTLSFPLHEDILIDGDFLDCMENALPDLSANPALFLTADEISQHYSPVSGQFRELLEQSFAAFCLGFESMQPYKGKSRIINNSEGKDGKGTFGGGQSHRVKWRIGQKESFLPPSN